jgi:tetratricopeptide (TPR) repeat protein
MGTLRFEPEPAHHGWFTWRRAILGGWAALAVLVLLTAGFIVSRLTGIGPGRTLLTAGVLAAEDRILLLDFENRTTDSALGRSVTEALRIDLGQSRVMRLVDASDLAAALQRMGRAPDTEMDLALARDLGQREGIKAIVAGEITTLGAGYVLSARVLSAATGETLIPLRETAADASELIAAVDRLSKALREKVGESLRAIRAGQPLERVTTSSLSALRLYTEGVEASDVGRNEEGVRLLRRAVEEDSTFAMAWRKLGVLLVRTRQASQEEIDNAVTRAFRLRDRLPPVERYLAEAYYHNTITGDEERSAAAYRAVLDVDPDEPTALNNLSIYLTNVGRADEAETLLRHLVEIRSFQTGYTNLFSALITLGKDAAADSVIQEVKRRWPDGATVLTLEVIRETVHRDFHAADSVLRAHSRDPRADLSARLAYAWDKVTVAGTLGQLDRMSEEAGTLRATLLTANPGLAFSLELLPSMLRARLVARPGEGAAAVDTALRRSPLSTLPAPDRPFQSLAWAYAGAGRRSEVRQLYAEWKQANPENRRPKTAVHAWEGIVALSESRWRDAAQSFDAAQAEGKCVPCNLYDAAEAWDRAGEPDSAMVRWERVVTSIPTGSAPFDEMFSLALAYRRLGELYEAKGNSEKALDYYGRFTTLWRDADPELQPQVREVKQRMARLVGERT